MTTGGSVWRSELKERLMRDFSAAERTFFLKAASEAVLRKGYRAGDDLCQYCYYLTLRERIRGIDVQGGPGYMRFLHAEGAKDVEDAIRMYGERLELTKRSSPDPGAAEFLERLGE